MSLQTDEIHALRREVAELKADLAQREEIEQDLRHREVGLLAMLEQMPAMLWAVDRDLRVTISIGSGLKRINVSPNELVGKTLFDYFITTDRNHPDIQRHLRAIAGETVIRESVTEGRVLFSHLQPLKAKSGETIGAVGVAVDLTEQKTIESEKARALEKVEDLLVELRRSNSALEQFAAMASHDLREPLRAVSTHMELIRKSITDKLNEQELEHMSYAIEGAKRMDNLIQSLLQYSQLGAAINHTESIDLNVVFERCLFSLSEVIKESNADIRSDNLPIILGNTNQMQQLFQNLLGNALKYRKEESPVIRISCVKKDPVFEFSVIDNGIGFNQSEAQIIFEAFRRLHGRDKYPGVGLGLSICKKIIEEHRGRIWAESEGEGLGACIRFTLPTI